MSRPEKKPLPDPKSYDVIPPDMDYVYFENAEMFPLEPEKTDYSPVNAWWFGECSFLAYCHPGFVRMAYRLAGFPGFRFFKGKGTECMVSWNNDAMIVSFRGTELKSRSAMHEIKTDMNTTPVPFEGGGRVHKGFLMGLEEIWDGPEGLKDFLETTLEDHPTRPLWISGHSLGGALATLCFARIPQARGLYVYGAPRVGDQEFVDILQDRAVWRVEHARDPVPMVPPDIPRLKFNFKDPGQLIYVSKGGQIQDKRPVFHLVEQKTRFAGVKEIQDSRKNEINRSIVKAPLNVEGSKEVLGKIQEHLQLSRQEWKDHLDELNDWVGLKVDDHQPVFYVIKLWNVLAAGD
jgi:triacylglycerol lipase